MENIPLLKSKQNELNIINEFKQENENLKLSLRKKKINQILFSKRKITFKENTEEIKQKYCINIEDIQIPNELKIDIQTFINKVRQIFILSKIYLKYSLI